jgi:hypothetical protein
MYNRPYRHVSVHYSRLCHSVEPRPETASLAADVPSCRPDKAALAVLVLVVAIAWHGMVVLQRYL